jgi:hypothetical protein
MAVGIVTDRGLDGPGRGSNPGGGEIFRVVHTGREAYPAFCTMDTEYFLG